MSDLDAKDQDYESYNKQVMFFVPKMPTTSVSGGQKMTVPWKQWVSTGYKTQKQG